MVFPDRHRFTIVPDDTPTFAWKPGLRLFQCVPQAVDQVTSLIRLLQKAGQPLAGEAVDRFLLVVSAGENDTHIASDATLSRSRAYSLPGC